MSTALDAAFACLVAQQHGVFTRRQASQAGYSRSAVRWHVRQRRWHVLSPTVLVVPGSPDTPQRRRWAALLEAGERSALSHETAAVMRGVPGFSERIVNVTKHETRRHELALARLHCNARLPAWHIEEIDGLRVTNIARTIFDLAGDPPPHYWRKPKLLEIHEKRIARALDTSLARLGNSIEQQMTVNAELCRRGRPGSRMMRKLLEERTESGWAPTESDLEDMFVAFCAAHDIEPPVRQRHLGEDRPRRIDFAYLHIRLIIEVDGRAFHDSLTDDDEDRWRDIEMAALGYGVMHIKWKDLVYRPDWLAGQIKKALARAGAAA